MDINEHVEIATVYFIGCDDATLCRFGLEKRQELLDDLKRDTNKIDILQYVGKQR